jgi:hypothetical protein
MASLGRGEGDDEIDEMGVDALPRLDTRKPVA